MVKKLRLYTDGTVSVVQMPHLNTGFVHVVATPTRAGLLYYIGHRTSRRTREIKVLAGGFRTRDRAFQELSKQIRAIPDVVPKYDPMIKRAYSWEDAHVEPSFREERLTRDQVLELIYRVCGDFKLEPPEVLFIPKSRYCYLARCERGRPFLIMSEDAVFVNTAVILHELAHYLADLAGHRPNHGPAWVREYLRLLTTYTTFKLEDLTKSLREYRVTYWLPTQPFSPKL